MRRPDRIQRTRNHHSEKTDMCIDEQKQTNLLDLLVTIVRHLRTLALTLALVEIDPKSLIVLASCITSICHVRQEVEQSAGDHQVRLRRGTQVEGTLGSPAVMCIGMSRLTSLAQSA